jgi:hypothetical protein
VLLLLIMCRHLIGKAVLSLWLKGELRYLLAAYFALGFDQTIISQTDHLKHITMGKLWSLSFICKYGRPMYISLVHIQDVSHDTLGGMCCFHKNGSIYLTLLK